jgi:hypothetical protein
MTQIDFDADKAHDQDGSDQQEKQPAYALEKNTEEGFHTYGRKIRLDFVTYGYSTTLFPTHRTT